MKVVEERHLREVDELTQRHQREFKELRDRHRREADDGKRDGQDNKSWNNYKDDWKKDDWKKDEWKKADWHSYNEPAARERDSPARPRPSQDKGKGKARENKGNSGGPSDAGELTHARMMRLLKLLQRSKAFTPANFVRDRWNDFCDTSTPPGSDGRAMRDPKQIDMELIIRFLLDNLPRVFWSTLVKKMQGGGRDVGLPQLWNDFCDDFAPEMKEGAGKSLRDPKQLDPELLLAFISSTVEIKGQLGDHATEVIDEYQFDFVDKPGKGGKGAERGDRGDRGGGGGGADREDARSKGGKASDRGGGGAEREERSKGKGKDQVDRKKVNGAEKAFTDVVDVDLRGLDSRFPFGSRIIGKEGCNVKHIRENTGASIWLGGQGTGRLEHDTLEESPKPMHVKVTADDEESLEKAVKIARDLLLQVYDDYYDWLDKQDANEDKGNRKGRGKDSPSRRPDFDDDREQKRPRRD